jgi:hypothetical protein
MSGASKAIFARDEEHYKRSFDCGWGPREETALEVARRVRGLIERLVEVEPGHGEIWPLFVARNPKRGRDPNPVLEHTVEALGDLIDRRARYDPPRFPAPVCETGYQLIFAARRPMDPLYLEGSVHAGNQSPPLSWNPPNKADLEYHLDHRIWSDERLALQVLSALIDTLQPDWACATAGVSATETDERPHKRPWLAWRAAGREIPEFYVGRGGPPREVRAHRRGELSIWD